MSHVYVHFCSQPYYLIYLVNTLCISFFLHLLSTNHKCTQPYYFPLLYKPTAQKVKVVMKNYVMSSRLCTAPVLVPMALCSLLLFYCARELLSL
jgi:hypothetical protein